MKRCEKKLKATRDSDWLVGGGEMGALIRSMDWSATPIGPREDWPAILQLAWIRCPHYIQDNPILPF